MSGNQPEMPPAYDEAMKPGASFTSPPVGSVDVAQAQPPLQPINQFPPPPQPVFIQQQQPMRTVIIQPGGQAQTVYMSQPNVVIVHPVKNAPCFHPYTETCPYCNCSVVTHRRFVNGGMTCIFLILGIIFLPFLFFICCDAFKDAHHYCPRCHRLIAIRRR